MSQSSQRRSDRGARHCPPPAADRAEHQSGARPLRRSAGQPGTAGDCRLRGDRATIIGRSPSACWRQASSCGSCPRSRSPARARRCTTAGTRTIPRTRRSSCTCSGSARRRPTAIRSLPAFNDIQELSKTHEVVSKAKTELWHRLLTHYLPLYFPEIERFAGNSRSDWFLAFLEQFPTPASITAFAKEAFVEAAWDVVGKKVVESPAFGRYLRDRALFHRPAGARSTARPSRCSAWSSPRDAA